jgi:hypothetical protein
VRASVGDSVWDSVWDSVGASVRASVGASVGDSVYGQHEAHWLAFYRYFHDVCGLTEQTERFAGLWMVAESAGWWLPHEHICWVSERHNILHRDGEGRLHNESGMALAYPDGWGVYAVHGVRVPEKVILAPDTLTTDEVLKEQNVEIRRVMLERFGFDNFLRASNAKRIQADDYGDLYRVEIPGDEPLVVVRVRNSTPEPDGSVRDYVLRVPPDVETARQAVAWTFDVQQAEYAPLTET